MLYELRTYESLPGKLPALNKRFATKMASARTSGTPRVFMPYAGGRQLAWIPPGTHLLECRYYAPGVASMARIPLPTRESLTDAVAQQRWDRFAERGPVLNVLRLFLVNPTIELNARQLWQASGLEPRVREIVILRCAATQQSSYEWHQHVRIATGAGLTAAEINAVRHWQNAACFAAAERVLLAYVDELAMKPRPDEAVFAALAQGRSPAEVLGVTMLITQYFQLAHVMAALDLETEEPFVGWAL